MDAHQSVLDRCVRKLSVVLLLVSMALAIAGVMYRVSYSRGGHSSDQLIKKAIGFGCSSLGIALIGLFTGLVVWRVRPPARNRMIWLGVAIGSVCGGSAVWWLVG